MGNKLLRECEKELNSLGYFKVCRKSKHHVFRHPCGAQVVMGRSPSDRYALKNTVKDAQRELRKRGLTVPGRKVKG